MHRQKNNKTLGALPPIPHKLLKKFNQNFDTETAHLRGFFYFFHEIFSRKFVGVWK